MRISVNLATRPYADIGPALKRVRIALAVLVVLGIGLVLGLRAFHQKAEEARASEQSVQSKIDAITQERQGYQTMMSQPENADLLTQVAALNQLFDQKTFSWTLAMEDLETVLPGGVQVTTIEPVRDKEGHIILHMRVVGPRDHADDLVENLEHSKHFLLPHIVGESSESTGGANERLEPVSASNRFTFELLAEYNSAAPMESKAEKQKLEEKIRQVEEKTTKKNKPQAAPASQFHPAAPQAARPLPAPLMRGPMPAPMPVPMQGQPPQRSPYTGPPQNRPFPNRNPNSPPRPTPMPNPNQIPNQNAGGPQ
jgi:type IV pilus assembly protein PilN